MGGAVSAGEDNDELIDNLVGADYIKSKNIEAIFRAVDRGDYYTPGFKENAYRDSAWKHGHLHISAPCIYSEVMEALELKPGHSFLNIGSGTGYLSTMVGLMIGPIGINHGIELHAEVVEYAQKRLDQFKSSSSALYKYDFSEPIFVIGNGLSFVDHRQYDRVYVGAAIGSDQETFMCNMLTIGGILVVPLGDQLLQIKRVSTSEWTRKSILPVSFASLVRPSSGTVIGTSLIDVKFPELEPMSLKEITRTVINRIIRQNVALKNPELIDPSRSKRGKRSTVMVKSRRRRRIAKRLVAFVASNRQAFDPMASSSDSNASGSDHERIDLRTSSESSSSDSSIHPAMEADIMVKPSTSSGSASDTSGLGESVTSTSVLESLVGSARESIRSSLDDTIPEPEGRITECSTKASPASDEAPIPGPSTCSVSDVPPPCRRRPVSVLPSSLTGIISSVFGTVSDDDEDSEVETSKLPPTIEIDSSVSSAEDMDTSSSSSSSSASNGGNRTCSESSSGTTDGPDSMIAEETSSSDEGIKPEESKVSTEQSPLTMFGNKCQDIIAELPLPLPLKVYLNYDRPFLIESFR